MVFPKSSLLAHSCVPNCTWSVAYSPDFSMRIRASKTIEKGEMLTVSYSHNWNYYGTPERQKLILDTAGFLCKCDRCIDPTELGTCMSSVKCPSPHCSTYLSPIMTTTQTFVQKQLSPADNTASQWKCENPSCHQEENFPSPQIQIRNIEQEWNEILNTMNILPLRIGLELIDNFINTYSGKVLHPNHWLLQQVSRTLVRVQGGNLKSLDFYQLQNFITHCRYLLPFANVLTPGISPDRGD